MAVHAKTQERQWAEAAMAELTGIIKEDRLGFDAIYLQAKRWGRHCGQAGLCRPLPAAWKGIEPEKALPDHDISVLPGCIGLCYQDREEDCTNRRRGLPRSMIDYGIGVAADAIYEIKRLDTDSL